MGNIGTSVTRPPVTANHFEIKTTFISFIKEDQFYGHLGEDPNDHLALFLEKCDTLKMNGVTEDALRLRLFPFSLAAKARQWLNSQDPNSFSTWDELSNAFLVRYFPPDLANKLRNDIHAFHSEGESLYEAWERFKDLQRKCPPHGIEPWLLIQTFYCGLPPTMRMSIDAAAGRSLMALAPSGAKTLIENMASNNYLWQSKKQFLKKVMVSLRKRFYF